MALDARTKARIPPRIARRSFIAALASAVGAVGAALHRRRTSSPSPSQDDLATARILLAATAAVVGMSFERSHYESYFTWRLAHLPDASAAYRRAAASLERAAREELGAAFDRASDRDRARLCERCLDPALRREILELFAATDAWTALGYDGWPGMARGFSHDAGPT